MKTFLLLLGFLTAGSMAAQEDAWVYFTDKPNAATYYADPLLMLSQSALDRREAQDIALDIKDIPISASYVAQVEAASGITVMARSKWLNAVHVRGTAANIQALSSLSFVDGIDFADAALNTAGKSGKTAKPASPTTAARLHQSHKVHDVEVVYPYGNSDNQIEMLNGHLLHQQDYIGTGKTIAVLDAGFPNVNTAAPFSNLIANAQILGGYDFVNNSSNFYAGNNHGTSVLSTMGGYVANQLVGTAPGASYYLFITEDVATENPVEESYWVEAAERADSLGVDVISTSLGYFGYDDPDYSYTYSQMDGQTAFISRGADIAFSRGMMVVVSAGNSGGTSNPHIGVPADAFNVLTVGAVDANGIYASFSSTGYSADGRVKPDVVAQGQQAVVSYSSGAIGASNGTSFSGPIIAGMVACLWQALPELTNMELLQLIKQSSSIYTVPNSQLGYGIPNFYSALSTAFPVAPGPSGPYPNPAGDFVSFDFSAVSAQLTLFTPLGQKVLERAIRPLEAIDIPLLTKGIYLCELRFGNTLKTAKLIKR